MFLPRSPMYGMPNYDFYEETTPDSNDYDDIHDEEMKVEAVPGDLNQMAFWYMVVLVIMLTAWLFVFFCLRVIALRQKTRSSQQQNSRVRVARRMHDHEAMHEPPIYVSQANMPPPKYEVMAPPSYDEVMSVHYPNYNRAQPIIQPLTHALAHSSTENVNNVPANLTNVNNVTANVTSVNNVDETAPAHTVVTVTTEDRQTSITVRS